MNKVVTPKQLELTAGKTREELLVQSLPSHIDPESPAFKADLAKVDKIEKQEAARAVLGVDEMSHANQILTSLGMKPNDNNEDNEDNFDWIDDDSIILKEQRATAAYRNKHGDLVIRQQAAWNDEHDAFVVLTPENEITFMEGLAKAHREG